jgi:uncharacterized protein
VRVVLDTNILISACLQPGKLEAQTIQLALEDAFTVCVSSAVWAEYCDVLYRPKFGKQREQAATLLDALAKKALLVCPVETVTAASDPDDNRLLECAAAGAAHYLITGNRRHFPSLWRCTQVLNTREFLLREFPACLCDGSESHTSSEKNT